MREILFRGKRLCNSEWCYGFYVHLKDFKGNERHRIYDGVAESEIEDGENRTFYPDAFDVDPKTVGQFTGLLDKNGEQIYEGDIMILHKKNSVETGEVVFVWGGYCLSPKGYCLSSFDGDRGEVIGNIHDNPELKK